MSEEVKEATEVAVEEVKAEESNEVVETAEGSDGSDNSVVLEGKMAEFVDWIETISVIDSFGFFIT